MSQRGRPSFQPSRLSLSPQSQAASHERVAAIRDDGRDHSSSDYSHGPGPTPEDRCRPPSARSLGISQSHAAQEPGTPASQAGLTPGGNTPTERHSPANARRVLEEWALLGSISRNPETTKCPFSTLKPPREGSFEGTETAALTTLVPYQAYHSRDRTLL
ncbi:hypothetical protein HYQ44_007484 [Verticillium longisporum]|nr:hypothetical protein HYQ44_007484 [Verticillium longisporum]